MKVLFINVSRRWEGRVYKEYPHGLGIIATLAQNAGHEVRILDMALEQRSPQTIVEEFNPEVIGLSFPSTSLSVADDVIRSINSYFRGHLISGGIHSTLYPVETVEKGVDVIVVGEGELALIPLLEYLEGKEPGRYIDQDMASIPGIVYRNKQGEIKKTNPSQCSVDLGSLPIMNRELFDLSLYSHHSILTSRGCPYSCRFCCSWAPGGRSGRTMPPQRIMDELEYLVERFGPIKLYWADEIFFWNFKERLQFLRTLKKKRLPIEFTAQLRADLLNEELVEALMEAGCTKLCIGAESGSDPILKAINKKMLSEQIEQGIDISVKKGLRTKTWWMVGLPGGDVKEQLAALNIIERARPHEVAVHQFVPLPGSEFWDNAKDFGINLPQEAMFDNLSYYSNAQDLSFGYLSSEKLYSILKEYESRLNAMGYVPTDLADETTPYVFTTPFQKTTFEI